MLFTRKSILPALTVALLATPFAAFAQTQPDASQQPVAQPSALPAVGATVHAPIKAGGIVALDLPDSTAQAITLDILKGRFADYSVGRIKLTGNGIDFRNGTLQGLLADITDGDFDNLAVDQLSLNAPAFAFNTMELINNRTFILNQPVTATVKLMVSEAGLNRFIASPRTLEKVEKAIQKKTGGLKLITFSNPSLSFVGANQVKLKVTGMVAQGLAVPLEMNGKLAVQNGQVGLTGMTVSSGGSDLQLPVDVANVFQDKINELIDLKRLGKNSLVITADSMKQTGKKLQIDGHATLTKLKFG